MKYYLPLIAFFMVSTLFGQVTYPYNPDENSDAYISTPDLMSFLTFYGQSFSPSAITIDSLELPVVIGDLQEQIDSLSVFVTEGLETGFSNDSLLLEYIASLQSISSQADSMIMAWLEDLSQELELLTAESVHGVFDTEEMEGLDSLFVVPNGVNMITAFFTGTSGGSGGNICGTTGNGSCNLCNAGGGSGGSAVTARVVIGNLSQGDSLTITMANSGASSQDLITCSPGFNGWNNWNCGPAPSGQPGEVASVRLNGELLMHIEPGTGGGGACIGCQGDGCYGGNGGENGYVHSVAEYLEYSVSYSQVSRSRMVVKY